MKYEEERVLKRGDKFVAINRKTGHKALAGGVCTATKVKLTRKGITESVEARDFDCPKPEEPNRLFVNHEWSFSFRN